MAGAGLDFKSIVPRTIDLLGNITRQRVNSAAVIGYVKLTGTHFTWKAFGTLGQNMAGHLMLGGIAETSIDTISGSYECAPMNIAAVWTELSGNFGHLEWRIFAGSTKNIGIEKPLNGSVYALGKDIDGVYRLSPRVGWKYGKTKLGLETEYTVAQYGRMTNEMTGIATENIGRVANLRILATAILTF